MVARLLNPGELYSIACAALWAVAVLLFRASGEQVPPLALNLFKNVVGLLLFFVTLPLLGVALFPPELSWQDWAIMLASGAVGIGIADTLFFAGLNRMGATGAAIVNALYTPFLLLAATLYLHEPVGLGLLASMALMIVAVFLGAEREPGPGGGAARRPGALQGIALGALSMALMAVGIVFAKPVLNRVDPWWAITVRLIGGVALLVVQSALPGNRAAALAAFVPSRAWRVSVPAAVVGAYMALILWLLGMKLTETTVAGVLNQLSTVFVIVFAALFLHEPLRPRRVAAVVLGFVAGAVAVI